LTYLGPIKNDKTMKANSQNHGKLTAKQAIKLAKACFREEHGRRVPNHAGISVHPRYGGGRYVLITGAGLTTEFYFN
jgi:hypothetical protein